MSHVPAGPVNFLQEVMFMYWPSYNCSLALIKLFVCQLLHVRILSIPLASINMIVWLIINVVLCGCNPRFRVELLLSAVQDVLYLFHFCFRSVWYQFSIICVASALVSSRFVFQTSGLGADKQMPSDSIGENKDKVVDSAYDYYFQTVKLMKFISRTQIACCQSNGEFPCCNLFIVHASLQLTPNKIFPKT